MTRGALLCVMSRGARGFSKQQRPNESGPAQGADGQSGGLSSKILLQPDTKGLLCEETVFFR